MKPLARQSLGQLLFVVCSNEHFRTVLQSHQRYGYQIVLTLPVGRDVQFPAMCLPCALLTRASLCARGGMDSSPRVHGTQVLFRSTKMNETKPPLKEAKHSKTQNQKNFRLCRPAPQKMNLAQENRRNFFSIFGCLRTDFAKIKIKTPNAKISIL